MCDVRAYGKFLNIFDRCSNPVNQMNDGSQPVTTPSTPSAAAAGMRQATQPSDGNGPAVMTFPLASPVPDMAMGEMSTSGRQQDNHDPIRYVSCHCWTFIMPCFWLQCCSYRLQACGYRLQATGPMFTVRYPCLYLNSLTLHTSCRHTPVPKRARLDYGQLKGHTACRKRKNSVLLALAPQAIALKTLSLYIQRHGSLDMGIRLLEKHHTRGDWGKPAVEAAVKAAHNVCQELGPENCQDVSRLVKALDKQYIQAVSSSLSKVVTTRIMYQMVKGDAYQTVRRRVQQEGLNKMLAELTPEKVLRICDLARVSTEGWTTVWKALKEAATGLGVKLCTRKCAANPYSVDREKKRLDTEAQLTMLKGSECTEDAVHLDFYNVLQVAAASSLDRAILSRSTLLEDGKLKVCICLDETKWFAERKLERVCLKIMNEVMKDPDDRLPDTRFQSEDDVFPLSLFYVAKEDYDSLSHGLQHLREIVEELEAGKLVTIPGVKAEDGSPYQFQVECHLAADLKTLHLMYQVNRALVVRLCTISYMLYLLTTQVINL